MNFGVRVDEVRKESLGLGVDGVMVNGVTPWVVNTRDLEDQPATVAGVVGEEERVVARGAERGHVRQVDLVAAVGGPLVDEEGGGHGLDLVQFGRPHGVDLLEVDQQLLGDGEKIVFREPLAVRLRGVIMAQYGGAGYFERKRSYRSLVARSGRGSIG